MNEKKAIVAGHLCVDITPEFPAGFTEELANIMQPGKLTNVKGVCFSTGGVVANTGVAMDYLGANVELMGKLATDDLGYMISNKLKSHGVKANISWCNDTNTSYSIVLASPGHDRTFLHSPGTNDTFVFDDLNMDSIRNASLFHFGYPPLMQKMYENEGHELIRIFKNVSEAGPVTSLDMAVIDPLAPVGQANWGQILENVIPYTDIFAPSVEELLYMLDRDMFYELNEKAAGQDLTLILDIDKVVKPLGDKLLELGAGIILIKCGTPGLYYRTGSEKVLTRIEEKLGFPLSGWVEREGFEQSYVPERVLSGTGAGDTTIAAFLTSLLKEYPLEQCIQFAVGEGASCVESYDALSGLRTLEEIQLKIAKGWKKHPLI